MWFLPLGAYDDGSFDFYAPMVSKPDDLSSIAFYAQRVGQLTHYTRAPEFAEGLASCLRRQHGYARARHTRTSDSFQASFVDFETGRSIEIWATSDTTGVLIAQESWSGDIGSALAVPGRPAE